MREAATRIQLLNVNHPGMGRKVDVRVYEAMRRAVLAVLPPDAPGMTVAELQKAVPPHLPQDLFPGGAKSGWWTKAVQLDLEARGIVERTQTSPIRLRRAAGAP